jgi:hypothetical protein
VVDVRFDNMVVKDGRWYLIDAAECATQIGQALPNIVLAAPLNAGQPATRRVDIIQLHAAIVNNAIVQTELQNHANGNAILAAMAANNKSAAQLLSMAVTKAYLAAAVP